MSVTIDVQVDSNANSGGYYQQVSGTAFGTGSLGYSFAGNSGGTRYATWYRFTGVSGLNGTTIDVAYLSINGSSTAGSGTPLMKLYADYSAAPTAPTTAAEGRGKTRTSVGVDWDGLITVHLDWSNSPSLVSPIQEVATSLNPTAIQILQDEDGAASNNYEYYARTYGVGPTVAPKLHIEYTAGGGGAARRVMVVS